MIKEIIEKRNKNIVEKKKKKIEEFYSKKINEALSEDLLKYFNEEISGETILQSVRDERALELNSTIDNLIEKKNLEIEQLMSKAIK